MVLLLREASEHGGGKPRPQNQALGHKASLHRCVSSGKLRGFSGLQFPSLQNGNNITHPATL